MDNLAIEILVFGLLILGAVLHGVTGLGFPIVSTMSVMIHHLPPIIALSVCVGVSHAKPVTASKIEDITKIAPIIAVAEIKRHQYESYLQGEVVTTSRYFFWQEYEIQSVLKNNTTNIKVSQGDVIKVRDKNNSCIDYEQTIKRVGDTLEITFNLRNKTQHEIKDIANFSRDNGKKVILFLEESSGEYQFAHVGWFVSPSDFSATKLALIERIIKDSSLQNQKIAD